MWFFPELTAALHDSRPILFTSSAKNTWRQGDWIIGGMPAGGYSVHPRRWLDENARREDENKEQP